MLQLATQGLAFIEVGKEAVLQLATQGLAFISSGVIVP